MSVQLTEAEIDTLLGLVAWASRSGAILDETGDIALAKLRDEKRRLSEPDGTDSPQPAF